MGAARVAAPFIDQNGWMHQIEHIVLLMMENRSFDHMIGFLAHPDATYRGLKGDESNIDRDGNVIRVDRDSDGTIPYDPHHLHKHVVRQLTGGDPPLRKAHVRMNGFASNAEEMPQAVMSCVDPKRVPALATLALEYTVCDQWFSSIPGETWPNRNYAHAGHSSRMVDNRPPRLFGVPTIFDRLSECGQSWTVFHDGIPQIAMFWKLWLGEAKSHFHPMEDFERAAAVGSLPAYSFIEPKHIIFDTNSQHPLNNKKRSRDFDAGDALIRRVYDALSRGPRWDQTLLVVTYDEHGGFFDQEKPIEVVSPHAGETDESDLGFDFTLSGARVPTVIASPWVKRGYVDHTPYEHSSIPHSIRERFCPDAAPLSPRDEASNTWWHLLQPAKRDDIPALPVAPERAEMALESLADRADPHLEAAESNDEDLKWLAEKIDLLLTAEEQPVAAEALARSLEEPDVAMLESVAVETKGEAGRYAERVGERLQRRARETRGEA